MNTRTRRASRAIAVGTTSVLLMSGLLAGCSDENGKEKGSDDPTKAPASADPSNISPPLKELPTIKNPTGAVSDLKLGDCQVDAGTQTTTGEITSSAKDATDYLVVVNWTNDSSDVMGRGFAVIKNIQPGDTEKFTIKAKVKDGAVQCVPNVQYGTIR